MSLPAVQGGRAHDVGAVVVAYFPQREVLVLIQTLRETLGTVWVVDNSPVASDWLSCLAQEGVRVLVPGQNLGVAGAYNLALRALRADQPNIQALFLFDQDSDPSVQCITRLVTALRDLWAAGEPVAQVGPAYYERQRNFYPPLIAVSRWRLRRTPLAQAQPVHRVSYMISSGSLVSLAALAQVGEFDESLFIDYVDIEFGLRCQHRGWSSWIVREASMAHAIGEAPLRFGRWTLPAHSALRRRYQARNAVLLMGRAYVPGVWKLQEAARAVLRFAFMALARNGAPGQIKGWCLGVWDGLRQKTGAIGS